jgi:type II secretory pathway pseudopilin PulG
MIKGNKNKKIISGFTLIEALVAISLLMIAISSPIMLAQKGLSSSILSRDQMIASFLAQDGIESVKNIRDDTAINQQSTQISFSEPSNGNNVCDDDSKMCVKVISGDSVISSCDETLDSGIAWCTEEEVDWLGKLVSCVCNLDGDYCDFDNDNVMYCNIDSSDLSMGSDSYIYATFGIDDSLFKKYSISGDDDYKTKFNRKINIKKIENNKNEAEVKVRVYWDSPYGVQKVEIKTFMYNFEPILIPYE